MQLRQRWKSLERPAAGSLSRFRSAGGCSSGCHNPGGRGVPLDPPLTGSAAVTPLASRGHQRAGDRASCTWGLSQDQSRTPPTHLQAQQEALPGAWRSSCPDRGQQGPSAPRHLPFGVMALSSVPGGATSRHKPQGQTVTVTLDASSRGGSPPHSEGVAVHHTQREREGSRGCPAPRRRGALSSPSRESQAIELGGPRDPRKLTAKRCAVGSPPGGELRRWAAG